MASYFSLVYDQLQSQTYFKTDLNTYFQTIPTNIWNFKLIDITVWLSESVLWFYWNHFLSLSLSEFEFQNSINGGK